jgi:transposase
MNNSSLAFDPWGIEVSSRSLIVAGRVGDSNQPLQEFPNTSDGHQAVLRQLNRSGRSPRVVLESTGLYGLDLALALHAAGVAVMVANPRAVRHFAQALLQRSKNDRLDAQVLREFAARMPFQPWSPPSAAALQLVAVTRRLEARTVNLTQEKNRLHAASLSTALPAILRRDLQLSIQSQQRAIQRLTDAALEFVLADPQLARRFELLLSIPGVGKTSALHLLAELTLLPAGMDVRQWTAYAGLDPRECSSGTSVHKKARISKAGNQHLRRALYMPALVAVVHQPHLRAFYQHLLARDKTKLQALVATMRKLLHLIFGMFKHDQLFQGSKAYALTDLPPTPHPSLQEVA